MTAESIQPLYSAAANIPFLLLMRPRGTVELVFLSTRWRVGYSNLGGGLTTVRVTSATPAVSLEVATHCREEKLAFVTID